MALSFSIITCTWNSMPWLDESIASVLMQDYPDLEYIFVDRGSTDETLDQIRALQRPYRLIEGVRGNIAKAMNEGLKAATGDIIAYLDADNYYLGPEVCSTVAGHLEKGRRGWLFGRAVLDIEGQPCPDGNRPPPYSYARLLRSNFIERPCAFVRRSLIERVGGFDTNLNYAMDYDLWLKLGCLSEPTQIDTALAAVREYEGSLWVDNRLAAMDESLRVRLAHEGKHPMALAFHYAWHLVQRQRAMLEGIGR